MNEQECKIGVVAIAQYHQHIYFQVMHWWHSSSIAWIEILSESNLDVKRTVWDRTWVHPVPKVNNPTQRDLVLVIPMSGCTHVLSQIVLLTSKCDSYSISIQAMLKECHQCITWKYMWWCYWAMATTPISHSCSLILI